MHLVGCFFILLVAVLFYFLISISWMSAALFTVIVFGVIVLVGLKARKDKHNKLKFNANRLETLKTQLRDFTVSEEYASPELESALFIDQDKNKLAIITDDLSKRRIYTPDQIVEAIIVEDGKIKDRTSSQTHMSERLSEDHLTEEKQKKKKGDKGKVVESLVLKIVVTDKEDPVRIINFLPTESIDFHGQPLPLKVDSQSYQHASKQVREWHRRIRKLID